MLRANLVAAVNVMLACHETGCRVVLAGSMEEPDLGDPRRCRSRRTRPPNGRRSRMPGCSTRSTSCRLCTCASSWCTAGRARHAQAGSLRHHFALRGEEPELTSGAREVDWIYVDDVVEAFLAAAVAPGAEGASLDIGSGELVSVRELAVRLSRLVGGDIEPRFGALPRGSWSACASPTPASPRSWTGGPAHRSTTGSHGPSPSIVTAGEQEVSATVGRARRPQRQGRGRALHRVGARRRTSPT